MIKALQGLFKITVILFLLATVCSADPSIPQPQGMVSDFAGKLSPDTKQKIETLLENFRNRSGIEIAVVTIPFDDMQGYPIEDYSLYMGRQWGVGRDSEKRALLLLVAIKPADSQGQYHGGTRLEVSRHLEGDIPDGLAGEIIRKMRDDFMAGRFDQALVNGTQTILATLAQKLGISMAGIDQNQAYQPAVRRPGRSRGISPFSIIILIFVVFVILRALGGGGRGPGGWMILPFLLGGGGDRGSGWGGGGSGGGGGGFGGFGGGGDFGGGGASDSW